MTLSKRLLNSGLGQALLVRLATSYLWLISRTTRWQTSSNAATERLLEAGGPFIVTFWHGRLAIAAAAATPYWRRANVLISPHRDGRLISAVVERLGIRTVSGSSHRGGAGAMIEMRDLLGRGECVVITPDGPRGPRMRAKSGAIKLAQLTGVPLLPVSAAIAGQRLLRTWDRFCLPRPFRRGVVRWGAPMLLPRVMDEAALEEQRVALERELTRLTLEADCALGLEPVEPAPLPEERHGHARA